VRAPSCSLQRRVIGAAQHEAGAEAALAEERIGADLELQVAGLQLPQPLGDHALADMGGDRDGQHLVAGPEPAFQPVEHGAADRRNARQHEHVPDLEPRRGRDRVVDQGRTLRHVRHAQARANATAPMSSSRSHSRG
jgi:hypothetical protein